MLDSSGQPAAPRGIRGMVLSRRMAALAAVVLIPLGIAATGFALADTGRGGAGERLPRSGAGLLRRR
ncbi:hypothetical protein [Streptomyces flaveolus]|uniref:hypothetical protein n=1 Tax=Streptomyces flaveolus TaxID=67297 RepID=UPI0037BC5820